VHVVAVGRLTANGVNLLGTAFALPSSILFATALHVSGLSDHNLVIAGREISGDYQDTSDAVLKYIPATIVAADPTRDLCVLKVGSAGIPGLAIGSTDTVKIGDRVEVFGYPHADMGRFVLTRQSSEIGAKILLEGGGVKSKHVVLNMVAQRGQSGSPVIDAARKSLVAVLIGAYARDRGVTVRFGGMDVTTPHQTTHAVSAHYLEEMMRSVR
jgi:S1-C subfamily serine protease